MLRLLRSKPVTQAWAVFGETQLVLVPLGLGGAGIELVAVSLTRGLCILLRFIFIIILAR